MQIQPNMLQVDMWNKIRIPYLGKSRVPPSFDSCYERRLATSWKELGSWEYCSEPRNPGRLQLILVSFVPAGDHARDLQSNSGKTTVYLEPVCETWCKSGGLPPNLSFIV